VLRHFVAAGLITLLHPLTPASRRPRPTTTQKIVGGIIAALLTGSPISTLFNPELDFAHLTCRALAQLGIQCPPPPHPVRV
ncbi:MAG: hypothetical protein J2P48_22070, partial [Alphaproteobacteria bacterium]|nr:hypothetical protein [Alphaproteobacteria bacterium]